MPQAAAQVRRRRRPRPFAAQPAPNPAAGPVFPANALATKVELLLNGTFTDITTYVYQRDKMVIHRGRADESGTMTPSTLALTLNNADGRFSPRNTAGAYYPYIGRNTQIRVSVNVTSATGVGYSGYRFSGEVSAWPPRWDTSGTDVYVSITASGITRRLQQNSSIGSAIRRYISLLTGVLAPVAYWPMEEAASATQFGNLITPGNSLTWSGTPTLASDTGFNGSDPIPLVSEAILTGSTGSFSSGGTATYTTPGTYQYVPSATPIPTVEVWGGGSGTGGGFWDVGGYIDLPGGGGEYAKETNVPVTVGALCTIVIGAGGVGGNNGGPWLGRPGTDPTSGADSSFTTDSGFVVRAHGGDRFGAGGTGSTNAVHFDGGTNLSGPGPGTAGNPTPGAAGPSSAGTASAGVGPNTPGSPGTTGKSPLTPPAGAGSGGRGGNASNPGGTGFNGAVPGGAGGSGGSPLNSGGGVSTGGNGGAGKVVITAGAGGSTPTTVVTRCLLHVPSAGSVNTATIMRTLISSGTLANIELYYGTGGKLGFRGNTGIFDSGLISFSADGQPLLVSMELGTSGANVTWKLTAIVPGSATVVATSSGSFVGTLGAASQVVVNPSGASGVNDVAIGHVIVQYALDDIVNLSQAVNGFAGERAGTRFTRLCRESRISSVLNGSVSDTPLMGPQLNRKLSDLFQEIEDADRGQLYEPRETFGLGYSTRVSLMNQVSVLTVDYTNATLAGVLEPAVDDQLVRNDITVSRVNGASVNTNLATGALSTLDPPNGIGDYSYSLTANLNTDTQVSNLSQWLLNQGTVDEYRYPTVTFDQTRAEVAGLLGQIAILDVGGFFQIFQPPPWLPAGTIKQLAFGFTETINAFEWTIDINAVPESPYEGAGLSWLWLTPPTTPSSRPRPTSRRCAASSRTCSPPPRSSTWSSTGMPGSPPRSRRCTPAVPRQ